MTHREHFNSMGQPKVRMSEQIAKQKAAQLGCNAYLCKWPDCNKWHLGNGDT
jgi:hypothetical protein